MRQSLNVELTSGDVDAIKNGGCAKSGEVGRFRRLVVGKTVCAKKKAKQGSCQKSLRGGGQ